MIRAEPRRREGKRQAEGDHFLCVLCAFARTMVSEIFRAEAQKAQSAKCIPLRVSASPRDVLGLTGNIGLIHRDIFSECADPSLARTTIDSIADGEPRNWTHVELTPGFGERGVMECWTWRYRA